MGIVPFVLSDEPDDDSAACPDQPIQAVLFDFHGTLAQVEPLTRSVEHAAAECGVALAPYQATILADALGALGWMGSGQPAKVLPDFAAAWADRDLSQADHREAFLGMASQTSGAFDGFAEAMYQRMVSPEGWVAHVDAAPTLERLRRLGASTAVITNIGFNLRPVAKQLGFEHLIDSWILSYEVGWCKPDPAIFRHACLSLEVDPESALMVGDSLADAGAKDLGCRTYLLPRADPGEVVGLDGVRRLVHSSHID